MAGTTQGGKRAAETNKKRYGKDFYRQIGKMGGLISRGGGFAKDPDLARRVGAIGGRNSHKGKGVPKGFSVYYMSRENK